MHLIRSIVGFSLLTALVGCINPDKIKISDVAKLSSPSAVISTKGINGKDGKGKEYVIELREHQYPYTYMKRYCESLNGEFVHHYESKYVRKNYSGYGMGSANVKPYLGGFACLTIPSWAVTIEPVSDRRNSTQDLTFLTLKTTVTTLDHIIATGKHYEQIDLKKKREQEALIAQETQKLKNQQLNYQRMLITQAPKANDVGRTICKDTNVSEYTGLVVLGQPQFRTVEDAKVIATFEGMSNNNIKINIKGWLSHNNQIASGSNVLYKQTPLQSGLVIWDNKDGWYKCYD